VRVKDREDGTSDAGGGIDPRSIAVQVDYVSGNDRSQVQGHQTMSVLAEGKNLTAVLDCKTCHKESEKSIGPSYTSISARYAKNPDAKSYLKGKIIRGGGGVWGEVAMAAHPDLKDEDASKIVDWILSLSAKKSDARLPATGTIVPSEKDAADGKRMQITATYTDRGAPSTRPVTSIGTLSLKGPLFRVDDSDSTQKIKTADYNGIKFAFPRTNSGWLLFNDIDLTGVAAVEFSYGMQEPLEKGYVIECRLDSAAGQMLAQVAASPTLSPGLHKAKAALTAQVVGRRRLYVVLRKADPAENKTLGLSSIRFLSK
jgi:cytochrome c